MTRFILLAFLTFLLVYIQTYVFLSDCSVGGVRDLDWIDDFDKSTGCLPSSLRYTLLFLIPIIWFIGVFIVSKKINQKNND